MNQQDLPWLAMPAEVTLLAVRESPNFLRPIEVEGLERITHSSWKEEVRETNQKVIQVASTNTQLSSGALRKWAGFWTQRSLSSHAPDQPPQNDLGRRVELGDSGDLIWELAPIDGANGELSLVNSGNDEERQPDVAGWQHYQLLGEKSPLMLSMRQRPSINRRYLGGVTVALVVVLGIGGWGVSRLSRAWRTVGMLVVTLVGAAWLSAVQGPLWIGGVVVVGCLLGLLRLILKPLSQTTS